MLKKGTILIIFALMAAMVNCGDDESSLNTGDCGAPTVDGTAQELDAGCRVADEEENVTIEGLTLGTGDSLVVAMFAGSIAGDNGFLLTVTGAGAITLAQGSTNLFTDTGIDVTDQTICVDVHGEEDPDHILIWLGDDCSGEADEEAAIFNTEDETGLSYTDATGSGFYYLVTDASGSAAVSSITTEEPFFEEAE